MVQQAIDLYRLITFSHFHRFIDRSAFLTQSGGHVAALRSNLRDLWSNPADYWCAKVVARHKFGYNQAPKEQTQIKCRANEKQTLIPARFKLQAYTFNNTIS